MSLSKAVRWSYVMDGGNQAVTAGITLVLARILGPVEFGVMAMAIAYLAFVELLVKQGMGSAIIQRKDLEPRHLHSAFWMIIAAAAAMTAISAFTSDWWAQLNRTPLLQPVILALSPVIVLHAISVVPDAVLRRRMEFRALAIRANVSSAVGGAVGVACAFAGAGVWSLVAQQLSTALLSAVIVSIAAGWLPRPEFSWIAARQLLPFSGSTLLGGLGVFVNNRADALLIGLFFGPTVVGLYRLAVRLTEMIVGLSVRALTSVALPELSRAQDDEPLLARRLVKVTWLAGITGVPALGILLACSAPLLTLLGDEWRLAIAPMRILCVVGIVRVVGAFSGPLLQAVGKPHKLAALSWTAGAMSAAAFVLAAELLKDSAVSAQLEGLALSRAVLYGGVLLAIHLVITVKVGHVSVPLLLRSVRSGCLAFVAAGLAGLLVAGVVGEVIVTPLGTLLLTAGLSTLVAGAVLLVADDRLRAAFIDSWNGFRTGRSPSPEPAPIDEHLPTAEAAREAFLES